jgi:hypothetical protein
VGKSCGGKAVVWWTDLRGKGTENSLNWALYSGDSPGGEESEMGVRIGGRGGRRLGRGAAQHCT